MIRTTNFWQKTNFFRCEALSLNFIINTACPPISAFVLTCFADEVVEGQFCFGLCLDSRSVYLLCENKPQSRTFSGFSSSSNCQCHDNVRTGKRTDKIWTGRKISYYWNIDLSKIRKSPERWCRKFWEFRTKENNRYNLSLSIYIHIYIHLSIYVNPSIYLSIYLSLSIY